MYLKSFALTNFRKFSNKDNTVSFVGGKSIKRNLDKNEINIAPETTLIIGKNNSGKTTIIEALIKLISNTKFSAEDFNFNYLKQLLDKYTIDYINNEKQKEPPTMFFTFTVVIDNSKEDLLTNIIPFMSVGDVKSSEVVVHAKWSPKDEVLFFSDVKKFVINACKYKNQKFDRFLELINETDFSISYLNKNMEKRDGFSLNKLIELEPISANKIKSEECLSNAFSKIVDYRYNHIMKTGETAGYYKLDDEIISINEKLTQHISDEHTVNINSSLSKMISGEKCQVLLKSDLTFKTLLRNVLKYEYIEGENNIPERQFGLGYTNLMMIVADILGYMEKYPEDSFNSQINLISIEEPETFMHPQMQELFIKNINEMISSLLEGKTKHVNSQIIITTHSAHILNSKIHEGESFDNINYITDKGSAASSVILSDDTILLKPDKKLGKKKKESESESEVRVKELEIYNKNLKFLRKHIKFKVSELFFSDAVIFVEGITEYTLLQYYIDKDKRLNKYYVSLILIDGAHAKVYENLIYLLNVPTLIITDIDIRRTKNEKGKIDEDDEISEYNEEGAKSDERKDDKEKSKPIFLQMDESAIKGRKTTNDTIHHFYKTNIVEDIINGAYVVNNNLMVSCQKQEINGFYPSSFEEALILTSAENNLINVTLEKVKADIYKSIVESEGGLIKNSYKMQMKLSKDKSDFANQLLYNLLTNDEEDFPDLPQYITDGLDFIVRRLGGEEK